MQEDGFEILKEALYSGSPRSTKIAATYGLRNMQGRMKKAALELLEQGLKHPDIDIPEKWRNNKRILISAMDENDIQKLKDEIYAFISGSVGQFSEETMLTNLRQKLSAEKALAALKDTRETLTQKKGEELLAIDLSQTLIALGEIVGETTPDDILNRIFSEFCIGK